MPIGDLLAQISGGAAQPSPVSKHEPSTRPMSAPIKRKATEELRGDALKAPRTATSSAGTGYKGTAHMTSASSTYVGTSRPATTPRPSMTGSTTTAKAGSAPARTSGTNGGKPLKATNGPAARPAPAAPPAKTGPPKKGSYAEILARAQRAQTSMGQVGKIQHKVTDKTPVRKERDDGRQDPRGASGKPAPMKGTPGRNGPGSQAPARPGYAGTARPSQTPGKLGSGLQRSATAGITKNGTSSARPGAPDRSRSKATPPEEPKKMKRAATATTGYTGTARPTPSTSKPGAKRAQNPGGALLSSRAVPRHDRSSRRSRYDDEEDEDMDDFIDYDDEEEEDENPRGKRYHYDSESESDMEAGMDDIYEEERRAERQAREEDAREQALEAKLKAEKEERKRRYLESSKR